MFSISFLEIVGYIASVLVLLSMLMSSILKLRVVNMIGAAIFSVYGFLIHAMPVGFLNLFIVFANIYYLYKLFGTNYNYSSHVISRNSSYLNKFLEFYKKDIIKFCPEFEYAIGQDGYSFFVLRDMAVAGVFLAHKANENDLFIELDYVIPEYRDLKSGIFIYKDKIEYFKTEGFKTLTTIPYTSSHAKYLKKMGFKEQIVDGKEQYVYSLDN